MRVVQYVYVVLTGGGFGNVPATVRFAAGSVYFVRLGSGVAGRLGISW
jgi:hypothetical protein